MSQPVAPSAGALHPSALHPSARQPRPGWDAVHATATAILPGLLRLLGVAPCDLDDVFQDVVFAAYRAFERFDPTRQLPAHPPGPAMPSGEAPVPQLGTGVAPPAGRPGARSAAAPPRRPSGTRTAAGAWLYGIAWRQVRHHLERAYRRREVPMGLADAPCFEHLDPARGAELRLAAEERRALTIHLLSSVSPELRILLVLKDTYEVSIAEIAQALELSESTVYTRLRLARADFRAAVKRLRAEERQVLGYNLFLFPFFPGVVLRAVRELPLDQRARRAPALAALEEGLADGSDRLRRATGTLRGGVVGSLAGGAAVAAVLLAMAPPPVAWARQFGSLVLPPGAALYGAHHGKTEPEPGAAPAPAPAAVSATAALKSKPPAPAPRPAEPEPAPIAEEQRWIDAAHEALLRDDPATALEQIEEHARRFPRGRLRSTRERLRVWATSALADAAGAPGDAPDGGK